MKLKQYVYEMIEIAKTDATTAKMEKFSNNALRLMSIKLTIAD